MVSAMEQNEAGVERRRSPGLGSGELKGRAVIH